MECATGPQDAVQDELHLEAVVPDSRGEDPQEGAAKSSAPDPQEGAQKEDSESDSDDLTEEWDQQYELCLQRYRFRLPQRMRLGWILCGVLSKSSPRLSVIAMSDISAYYNSTFRTPPRLGAAEPNIRKCSIQVPRDEDGGGWVTLPVLFAFERG